jgi:gluconolactonase
MRHRLAVLALMSAGLVGCASSGGSHLAELPPDATTKPAAELLRVVSYSEGVVFDHSGNIFISAADTVTVYHPDGTHAAWAVTGAPNGHKVLADDTHVLCDTKQKALLHLSADGKVIEKLSTECDGKSLRAPNDLSLDTAHGGFYFTDPGDSTKENPIGTIHYVDSKGKTSLVAGGYMFPNGLALTPDGKKLFVNESMKDRVIVFDVLSPGKVGPMQVFANLPAKNGTTQFDDEPDGMCLDAAGNLYVAVYGMGQVLVLDPTGKLLRRYETGMPSTSNVAFGGPRHDQLFVTGAFGENGKPGVPGGLVRFDLGVKGLVILPPKHSAATNHSY